MGAELQMGWRTLLLIGAGSVLLSGCEVSREQEAAQIESEILATPGAEQLYRTIKDEYPEDFDRLVAQYLSLDFSERRNQNRLDEVATTWLLGFLDQVVSDAIKAPASEMLAWSAAEHDLYSTLQRGAVRECAALTMGQSITVDESNAAAIAAITRRNHALVRASAAGRDDPQSYTDPDETAFLRLEDAIARTGIAPELQATLGSEEAMLALSPEQQCKVGVALYEGLTLLPDELEPEMAAC